MGLLSDQEIAAMLLALATILSTAVILGGVARGLHQPAVKGEILAGIILGPTVLGYLFPDVYTFLFSQSGNLLVTLEGMTTLSIALFLLVAGIEVDLSAVFRQRMSALLIGSVVLI